MIILPKGTESEMLRCDACSDERFDAYHVSTICAHGPQAHYRRELAQALMEAEDAAIMGEAL